MSEDCYKTLGVSRSATEDEIRKAYKSKALKYHPDKNSSPNANRRFQEILHAYQLLNEKVKRDDKDRCGSDGGDHRGFDSYKGGDGWQSSYNAHYKPQPIWVNLRLSLEEILHGCRKRQNIRFTVYPEWGGAPFTKYRSVWVDVPCGVWDGQEILIAQAGPRAFDGTAYDVVFVVRQRDHPQFKRYGDNLLYHAEVSWRNFTNSRRYHTIDVPLIEGGTRQVSVSRDEVASKNRMVFPGKGMRSYDNPSLRGDLFVELSFNHGWRRHRTANTSDGAGRRAPSSARGTERTHGSADYHTRGSSDYRTHGSADYRAHHHW